MQINFEIFKKYIPIIIEGKFIISTPWQILFLKKPLLTRRKYRGKTIYILIIIYYIKFLHYHCKRKLKCKC